MITRESQEKLTTEDIINYTMIWEGSQERKQLIEYKTYYQVDNTLITDKVNNRTLREIKPNNYLPTSYYQTLIDNLAGYMFQNVRYDPVEESDDIDRLTEVLKEGRQDEKDMMAGVQALAYNRAVELIYTVGDGVNNPEIKYSNIPPEQATLIYNTDIEPELFCVIWKRQVSKTLTGVITFYYDVIYKDEWQYYKSNDGLGLEQRQKPRKLLFTGVPVAIYTTQLLGDKAPLHSILRYVNALDWILTGNANEIEKLTDAILILGNCISDDDKKHLDEVKIIERVTKEMRAEYLVKDLKPEFRKFAAELLIKEMHKHSHVIDWYDKDFGLGGVESAKALKLRLFDMDQYSKRIEKVFIKGSRDRIKYINEILSVLENTDSEITITYERTIPSDFETMAQSLTSVDFLSNQTKVEKLGLDWGTEESRLKKQITIIPEEELNIDVPASPR